MSKLLHSKVAVLAAGAVLTAAVVAAQVDSPRDKQPGNTTGEVTKSDSQLAAWLLVDNRNEIAIAEFAKERAESDEVKNFAQQMIDAHSMSASKLEPLTAGLELPAAGEPPRSNPAVDESSGIDLVSLKSDLGAQCLQTAQRELEKKQGTDFDKCYMTQQVMAHMFMVDTLEVFKRYASPELLSQLEEDIASAQAHLEHAKKLHKKFDTTSAKTARRERISKQKQ